MSLDHDALAELIADAVDFAMAPVLERLAAAEARVQVYGELVTKRAPDPVEPSADLADSLTGLLRKELADLATPIVPTRKRVERDGASYVVTDEPVT